MEKTDIQTVEGNRTFYLCLLSAGALWNIVFGSIGVFNLEYHKSIFYHSVEKEAEFIANQFFWSAVIVAGTGYALVGLVNHRFRFFVTLGALGKIAFFVWVTYLWFSGVATNLAITIAVGDLLWALAFIAFIFQTRKYGYL